MRAMLNKMVLLAKTKSNTIEAFISKVLINSNINHDEFVSVNIVLKEYNKTKKTPAPTLSLMQIKKKEA